MPLDRKICKRRREKEKMRKRKRKKGETLKENGNYKAKISLRGGKISKKDSLRESLCKFDKSRLGKISFSEM